MKLTKHILDQVSWWEYKYNSLYEEDVIVIHFKKWYKRSKKITISREESYNIELSKQTGIQLSDYIIHREFIELRGQLEEYFKDK